ncbi:hypothetical protein CapIbe_013613 [Capra ibex]
MKGPKLTKISTRICSISYLVVDVSLDSQVLTGAFLREKQPGQLESSCHLSPCQRAMQSEQNQHACCVNMISRQASSLPSSRLPDLKSLP